MRGKGEREPTSAKGREDLCIGGERPRDLSSCGVSAAARPSLRAAPAGAAGARGLLSTNEGFARHTQLQRDVRLSAREKIQ